MTRRKKDQDVLLFKIRLGREEVEISPIYSVLHQLEITQGITLFPKARLKQSDKRIK